jgi:hypothetical protein
MVDTIIDVYGRIIERSRRNAPVDRKLDEVIVTDFLDLRSVPPVDADACIWCLGVSQTQVSKEAYVTITHDYAVAAATALITSTHNDCIYSSEIL